jgi:hypothetical protein
MPGNTTLRTSAVEASWTNARQPFRLMPRVAIAATVIAGTSITGHDALAAISLDTFTTATGSGTTQTFGEWGYQTWSAPAVTGTGILGTRTLTSRVWGNALPYYANAVLTSNSASTALLEANAFVSGWNNVGNWRVDINYGNFGTLDLSSPMTDLIVRGSGTFANFRSGTSVKVILADSATSASTSVELHRSWEWSTATVGDIRVPLDSLGATVDLHAISSVTIQFFSNMGGDAHSVVNYEIDALSIVPAPAAAPLLALVGLTARGRRRR